MAEAEPRRASTRGPDDPHHFFWLIDLLSLTSAFLLAYAFAPRLENLLLGGGAFLRPWIQAVSPETGGE